MIKESDRNAARSAMETALRLGASKARVTLVRSVEDLVAVRDGEIDRVTHCEDSSLSFALFVDGRYGSFSTNDFDPDALESFLGRAVGLTRLLEKDPCRDLPPRGRCCREALTGNELGLLDPSYDDLTPSERSRIALDASLKTRSGCTADGVRWKVVSEEGEYSDSVYDTVVVDSEGLECAHSENCFDYGVEVTVEAEGEKYSGYFWDSSSKLGGADFNACGPTALSKAVAQIGSDSVKGGKMNMVVDQDVASKVVSPILNALSAYSVQQENSFLVGTLGRAVFPEGMTLVDQPHIQGETCSKLFDSEGVATVEAPIIENGVVKIYFVNTYMAAKTGFEPTVEEATRPALKPWPREGLGRDEILSMAGEGILVTDFNGGNCNPATGDFSYGVEGFEFKSGKIVRPVSGMVVTGNILDLWSHFIASGSDARRCSSKLLPTLAFSNVDFN